MKNWLLSFIQNNWVQAICLDVVMIVVVLSPASKLHNVAMFSLWVIGIIGLINVITQEGILEMRKYFLRSSPRFMTYHWASEVVFVIVLAAMAHFALAAVFVTASIANYIDWQKLQKKVAEPDFDDALDQASHAMTDALSNNDKRNLH